MLDWDEAGVGPLALGYGYPLIAAFLSEELVIDHDSARAFYRGYKTRVETSTTTGCSTPPFSTPFGTCGSGTSTGAGSGSCTRSSMKIA